ncbi:SAC3 domain-containing protein [Roridomyces roridus]|uniref:SAC3 domain-containing protein n=1 Tax=Roridomyces roridus TaxID=1738132 RepID=A0AAD7FQ80_9AGAR|nr:SAC3 domain-containing protein [Roridomyces roridus]
MDDPLVPKRLEDAISIVGTCMDMCPRYERYRRERENNLFEWETIPGTKRVNHARAVKMYERAAGDKTIPSDLRPPLVLKKTLDYLFHDLLPRGGFSPTFNFIRDRSRSVRNDFTMQHNTDALAMECHERCARFHILALYLERDREGFSVAMEEQQLMNTLQSLKEYYNDHRATYQSPAELEMRIYHRLIHVRDQVERPEPVPLSRQVAQHPMYKLTTAFRAHVQEKSMPIGKNSRLRVEAEGMKIFGQLAGEMMGPGGGGKGMVFLVACILERLFGKATVDGIDDIKGDASWGDIIDGTTGAPAGAVEEVEVDDDDQDDIDLGEDDNSPEDQAMQSPSALQPSASIWLTENFGATPAATPFAPPPSAPVATAFSNFGPPKSVFGTNSAFAGKSVFGNTGPNSFGAMPNAATPVSTPQTSVLSNPFGKTIEQPVVSSSAPPAESVSIAIIAPPRVQNNPLGPTSTGDDKLSTSFSSSLPAPSPFNNIFAPVPKPPTVEFTDKGKGKSTEPFSWNPSTSTLNPQAPQFTPSVFQPQPVPKPVFGVAPIPIFNGFPTSVSSPSFSAPSTSTKPVKKSTPPLVIDTSPPVISSSAVTGPSSPMTPGHPPPLERVRPISLPSTPTIAAPMMPTTVAAPSPVPSMSRSVNPLLGLLRNSLQTSGLGGPSTSGMLSPLVLASPSATPLRHNFSPVKPQTREVSALNGDRKGKGKEKEDADADLEAKALTFERRGLGMRRSLALWQKRTTDHAEWAEACRQSEKYSEKVRRAREKGALKRPSPNGKAGDAVKRMKLLGNGEDEPDVAKKRVSPRRRKYETRRTDDDLAKRFQENKEDQARCWAEGSFLQTVRTVIKSKSVKPPSELWRLWLSLNPGSEATAVWLESVFSIPVVSNSSPHGYPGLIVFECTPLEGVEDELERKQCILDDCYRLREIIESLPERRHFVPSLLFFLWAAEERPLPGDLLDMRILLLLVSYTFCISAITSDLDHKFGEAMSALHLDVSGQLVQTLNFRDVFKLFDPIFNSFFSEWMESCTSGGVFDWTLYCRVLGSAVSVLNHTASLSMSLAAIELAVASWLTGSHLNSVAASAIATDLQSHREMGRDFPTLAFVDHLRGLALYQAEMGLPKGQTFFSQHANVELARSALTQAQRMSMRRSPKRRSRSLSEDTEPASFAHFKRQRLSSSFDESNGPSPASSPPHINGRVTPSPSNSTISLAPTDSSSAPRVTIAMLRALTKDVKNKYGKSGR